jgi:hypothetical protein
VSATVEIFFAPAAEQDLAVVNLRELEDRAAKLLQKGPFGYISGGSGDEITLRENVEAFDDSGSCPGISLVWTNLTSLPKSSAQRLPHPSFARPWLRMD